MSDDTESEAADRASLNLPSAQNELISAVAAANPHTVVVVDAGAPVAMPWLSQVASVVDAWYPGESNGTALASVLFGQTDPSGHLPVTFPTDLSQVPASSPSQFPGTGGEVQYSEGIDVGYRYYDANNETPLFPFGYGLSYTSVPYSHLQVTPSRSRTARSNPGTPACGCNGQSGNQVTVSATVTNTGKVAGSDVAQLYLGDPAAAGEPPRQLKGFQKVTLTAGAVRRPCASRSPATTCRTGTTRPTAGCSRMAVRRLRRRLLGAWPTCRCTAASRSTAPSGPATPPCQRAGHGDAGSTATGDRHPGQQRRLRDAAGAVHAQGPGRLDGEQPGAGHRRRRADRHRALHRDRAGRRQPGSPHADGHGHRRGSGEPRWP